jgi:hypothetical protein
MHLNFSIFPLDRPLRCPPSLQLFLTHLKHTVAIDHVRIGWLSNNGSYMIRSRHFLELIDNHAFGRECCELHKLLALLVGGELAHTGGGFLSCLWIHGPVPLVPLDLQGELLALQDKDGLGIGLQFDTAHLRILLGLLLFFLPILVLTSLRVLPSLVVTRVSQVKAALLLNRAMCHTTRLSRNKGESCRVERRKKIGDVVLSNRHKRVVCEEAHVWQSLKRYTNVQ